MWDNGGRNVKLDQGECIDVGPLSRDCAFIVAARRVRKGSERWFGWLANTWPKLWSTAGELEITNLLLVYCRRKGLQA